MHLCVMPWSFYVTKLCSQLRKLLSLHRHVFLHTQSPWIDEGLQVDSPGRPGWCAGYQRGTRQWWLQRLQQRRSEMRAARRGPRLGGHSCGQSFDIAAGPQTGRLCMALLGAGLALSLSIDPAITSHDTFIRDRLQRPGTLHSQELCHHIMC